MNEQPSTEPDNHIDYGYNPWWDSLSTFGWWELLLMWQRGWWWCVTDNGGFLQ